MPEQLPDPKHLDWLVEHHAKNQRTSATLHRLLREHPKQVKRRPLAPQARLLIGVSFSLWRAAFLSDKTSLLSDGDKDAEWFLGELIVPNAIAFVEGKKAKEWTFNYYAENARFRLEMYAQNYLDDVILGPLLAMNPKDEWERLHDAFEKAVKHFGQQLGAAN
jgi:hypothetical protein